MMSVVVRVGQRRGPAFWAALLLAIPAAACTDTGGTGPDTEPPTITAIDPADGATGVSSLPRLIARFSEPIDTGGITSELFTLRAESHTYRGRLSINGQSIEFVPSDPLDFGTTYIATLSPDIADRAGNRLGSAFHWTFSTDGLPAPALSEDSLRRHIRTLADDSLMGRAAGTPDELKAAEYIAHRFEAWGLTTAPGGAYIQPFQATAPRDGRAVSSRNVLAVVPGAGSLASQWIIVGAHYDAQGTWTLPGDSIAVLNGADDNASGTALVLELARTFRSWTASGGPGDGSRRSVLFAGFGAEEEGLLGSCYYADTSPIAWQADAMLNFDMVGRLRGNQLWTVGVESSSIWDDMLANANRAELDMDPSAPCYSCSDYACFRRNGVPWLWFYTGSHGDYHSPADDESLIVYPGMLRIGDLALRTLIRLAVAPG